MKKQAVLAFALTIVASFYFSEIIYENAQAEIDKAQAVDVASSGLGE